MALEDDLALLLNTHAKKAAVEANIIGKAINIREAVCDVEVNGEATLLDVRLHCIEDTLKSKFVVKPKDKSLVIVGIISNLKTERFIVQCSEIEEVITHIEDVQCSINSKGVLIKKGDDSLKEVLSLIIEATNQIAVVIGNNPDYTKLLKATKKLNNLLR